MADSVDQPTLAMKKFGGLLLVVVGLVLIGVGMGTTPLLTVLGAACVVVGAVLLVLKVVRRNQGKAS